MRSGNTDEVNCRRQHWNGDRRKDHSHDEARRQHGERLQGGFLEDEFLEDGGDLEVALILVMIYRCIEVEKKQKDL